MALHARDEQAVGHAGLRRFGKMKTMNTIGQDEFAVLWTKAQRLVAAYIAAAVPSFHDAEDILQEVALVLSRRRNDYDPALPFENWAVGIAKRQIQKHFRKSTTRAPVLLDSSLLEQFSRVYEAMTDELKGRQELLADCLKLVEGRGRRTLEMRYAKNLTGDEIAQQLGISHGAVRILLHRVRETIRDCVDRQQQRMERTS